jgi:hypothetical protein
MRIKRTRILVTRLVHIGPAQATMGHEHDCIGGALWSGKAGELRPVIARAANDEIGDLLASALNLISGSGGQSCRNPTVLGAQRDASTMAASSKGISQRTAMRGLTMV